GWVSGFTCTSSAIRLRPNTCARVVRLSGCAGASIRNSPWIALLPCRCQRRAEDLTELPLVALKVDRRIDAEAPGLIDRRHQNRDAVGIGVRMVGVNVSHQYRHDVREIRP